MTEAVAEEIVSKLEKLLTEKSPSAFDEFKVSIDDHPDEVDEISNQDISNHEIINDFLNDMISPNNGIETSWESMRGLGVENIDIAHTAIRMYNEQTINRGLFEQGLQESNAMEMQGSQISGSKRSRDQSNDNDNKDSDDGNSPIFERTKKQRTTQYTPVQPTILPPEEYTYFNQTSPPPIASPLVEQVGDQFAEDPPSGDVEFNMESMIESAFTVDQTGFVVNPLDQSFGSDVMVMEREEMREITFKDASANGLKVLDHKIEIFKKYLNHGSLLDIQFTSKGMVEATFFSRVKSGRYQGMWTPIHLAAFLGTTRVSDLEIEKPDIISEFTSKLSKYTAKLNYHHCARIESLRLFGMVERRPVESSLNFSVRETQDLDNLFTNYKNDTPILDPTCMYLYLKNVEDGKDPFGRVELDNHELRELMFIAFDNFIKDYISPNLQSSFQFNISKVVNFYTICIMILSVAFRGFSRYESISSNILLMHHILSILTGHEMSRNPDFNRFTFCRMIFTLRDFAKRIKSQYNIRTPQGAEPPRSSPVAATPQASLEEEILAATNAPRKSSSSGFVANLILRPQAPRGVSRSSSSAAETARFKSVNMELSKCAVFDLFLEMTEVIDNVHTYMSSLGQTIFPKALNDPNYVFWPNFLVNVHGEGFGVIPFNQLFSHMSVYWLKKHEDLSKGDYLSMSFSDHFDVDIYNLEVVRTIQKALEEDQTYAKEIAELLDKCDYDDPQLQKRKSLDSLISYHTPTLKALLALSYIMNMTSGVLKHWSISGRFMIAGDRTEESKLRGLRRETSIAISGKNTNLIDLFADSIAVSKESITTIGKTTQVNVQKTIPFAFFYSKEAIALIKNGGFYGPFIKYMEQFGLSFQNIMPGETKHPILERLNRSYQDLRDSGHPSRLNELYKRNPFLSHIQIDQSRLLGFLVYTKSVFRRGALNDPNRWFIKSILFVNDNKKLEFYPNPIAADQEPVVFVPKFKSPSENMSSEGRESNMMVIDGITNSGKTTLCKFHMLTNSIAKKGVNDGVMMVQVAKVEHNMKIFARQTGIYIVCPSPCYFKNKLMTISAPVKFVANIKLIVWDDMAVARSDDLLRSQVTDASNSQMQNILCTQQVVGTQMHATRDTHMMSYIYNQDPSSSHPDSLVAFKQASKPADLIADFLRTTKGEKWRWFYVGLQTPFMMCSDPLLTNAEHVNKTYVGVPETVFE